MGFFKNLKEGIAAQKKLVDAINKGDLVVDRKNLTIKPEKTSENNREESEQKNRLNNLNAITCKIITN
ncbi:MAG: hypothetical protein RR054_06155 [Clostridia bacterium]